MPRKKDKIDELLREYFQSESPKRSAGRYRELFPAALRRLRDENIVCESPCRMSPRPDSDPLKKVKALTHCPPADILGNYIEESPLEEKLLTWIKDHLDQCDACRAKVAEGMRVLKAHASGKIDRVPEDISSETSSKLSHLYKKGLTPRKKGKRL
jgi:hypothetical protein